MGEAERIDRVLSLQARHLHTAFDGAAAGLQFQIRQALEGGGEAEIVFSRLSDGLIQMAAHRRQAELFQFLWERNHPSPSFRGKEKRHIPAARADRWRAGLVPGY
jgi:hypothetical protein